MVLDYPWHCDHEPSIKRNQTAPYLVRQMSEDFSSRVVECTRLILD
jgi:hypothetical protein